jgi:hypothetical protein
MQQIVNLNKVNKVYNLSNLSKLNSTNKYFKFNESFSFITLTIFILFSQISLIKSLNVDCITGKPAINESSCFNNSSNYAYCCFLQTEISKNYTNICYKMMKAEFNREKEFLTYKGHEYSIKCPVKFFNPCYENYPDSPNQCHIQSNSTNSCCYYSYSYKAGCFWYGDKYQGVTTQAGITLICGSTRGIGKLNIFVLFFLFFLAFL